MNVCNQHYFDIYVYVLSMYVCTFICELSDLYCKCILSMTTFFLDYAISQLNILLPKHTYLI